MLPRVASPVPRDHNLSLQTCSPAPRPVPRYPRPMYAGFLGRALLFQHRVMHRACEVTAGEKFVLRTDILYAPPGP